MLRLPRRDCCENLFVLRSDGRSVQQASPLHLRHAEPHLIENAAVHPSSPLTVERIDERGVKAQIRVDSCLVRSWRHGKNLGVGFDSGLRNLSGGCELSQGSALETRSRAVDISHGRGINVYHACAAMRRSHKQSGGDKLFDRCFRTRSRNRERLRNCRLCHRRSRWHLSTQNPQAQLGGDGFHDTDHAKRSS